MPPESDYSRPVWVQDHHFEVDPRTGNVRIVVEYEFPFQSLEAFKYGGLGPEDTRTGVPGLDWNSSSREVIFQSGGTRTICAEAPPAFDKLKLKNTKSCRVVGTVRPRTPEDDPAIQGSKILDVWLETD